ncbi:5-formyltetrahydrofolate cyclo-ligase [Rubritalea tangerina]|uniref:5-formyltetrahydrofolate cyclo-ligase n=1 Tax=Rubritalea tangerina TaxID=430798 RepID=A0ABW4Z9X7_9BACT
MDFDPKLEKNRIRRAMREALKAFPSDLKAQASQQLCQQIVQFTQKHPNIRTIASFAALPMEPDLSALHQLLPHHHLVYPKSLPGGSMTFHRVAAFSDLSPGLFGILEPTDSSPHATPPQEIDLFLCPAYAYTHSGQRLGKGGGYYDRLLENRRDDAFLLGICYELQLHNSLPVEPHDIEVHSVLSAPSS